MTKEEREICNKNIKKVENEYKKVTEIFSNGLNYYINDTDSIYESYRLIREIDFDNNNTVAYDNELFELIKKIQKENKFTFKELISYLNLITVNLYRNIEDKYSVFKETFVKEL